MRSQSCALLPTLHLIEGPSAGVAGQSEIHIEHRAKTSVRPTCIIWGLDTGCVHDHEHSVRLERTRHSHRKFSVFIVCEMMDQE
jgi:hypothetical protein